MIRIKDISYKHCNLKLKNPFATATGRKMESRNGVIKVTLSNGKTGQGEASASLAWPDQNQKKFKSWVTQQRKKLRSQALGTPPFQTILKSLPRIKEFSAAQGAFESALWQAYAKSINTPLPHLFGPSKKTLLTDITLSLGVGPETNGIVRNYFKMGFRRFKLKISGPTLITDLARIYSLHKKNKAMQIWLDANQGLTLNHAKYLVKEIILNQWNVVALEQPFPKTNLKAFKALRTVCPFPVYIDESATSLKTVKKFIEARACDGVVIKIAKTGIKTGLEIVRYCRHQKKHVMLSCMAESASGLNSSVAWALGDGKFNWIDLDSGILTGTTPQQNEYNIKGPKISLWR